MFVCVNKPESGSGDISCSVDYRISGFEYSGKCLYVCMFVLLSQQNLVSTIALQPLEMQTQHSTGV